MIQVYKIVPSDSLVWFRILKVIATKDNLGGFVRSTQCQREHSVVDKLFIVQSVNEHICICILRAWSQSQNAISLKSREVSCFEDI